MRIPAIRSTESLCEILLEIQSRISMRDEAARNEFMRFSKNFLEKYAAKIATDDKNK